MSAEFVRAGTLAELRSKRTLIVRGPHRPILVISDGERVFALDNRCPHMGFPLDRGSFEDGILTCHWHHARFDLASGCTFDLWADDVPTCPVEVRGEDVWVKADFAYPEAAAHWRRRLEDGMAHNLGLVIAKALQGQLAAGVPPLDIVQQAALFGVRNRDGWGTGMTVLTALANLLPMLPKEETYLALFHGVRRVAADCDGAAPARPPSALASRPEPDALERWLRRWSAVRHRDAAERTALTAISSGAKPAVLADLLLTAETDRVFADGGHSLDFINKAFECLDLIGWQSATDVLPSVVGRMVRARGADEIDPVAPADRSGGVVAERCRRSRQGRDCGSRPRPMAVSRRAGAGSFGRRSRRHHCGAGRGRIRWRVARRCRPLARLRGGAADRAFRHRERACRLGDRASCLHLLQCGASGAEADRRCP